MDDLDEFESWHKDLSEWERFQYELERISGEKNYYKVCDLENKTLKNATNEQRKQNNTLSRR